MKIEIDRGQESLLKLLNQEIYDFVKIALRSQEKIAQGILMKKAA